MAIIKTKNKGYKNTKTGTYSATKSGGSSNSSKTGYTASGQDYSISGNPQVDAINKAKAESIGKKKADRRSGIDVSGYQDVDEQFGTSLKNAPQLDPTKVDVSQPQPGQVPVGPEPTSISNEAQQAFQSGYVKSPEEYQSAVTAGQSMGDRYKQGLAQVQGTQAPDTQGMAAPAITNAVPPAAEDTSFIDTLLTEDSGFQDLQTMFKDYFHPDTQKKSLVDEYKKLYKNSGLDELDEDIVDAQTVIEGTEDDIRNEIQAAGGFGTESQVQALASSRNKVLLKNYNNLVAMREIKQKNFDTMLNLVEKDRAYADQKAEQMLNFQFKVMDYKQKFIDNTRSQLNSIADKLGYQALYQAYSRDPRQLAFAEQILGVGSGGLANLASQRDLDREYKIAQINSANRSNQPSSGSEYETINGKPQNVSQTSANGYADRLNMADVTLSGIGNNFTGKYAFGGKLPNMLQTEERQAYEQAKKNFATAVLRRESGASIAPSEFETLNETYFPQAGDKPDVLANKDRLRNTVINSFYREANVNRPVLPGMVIYDEESGKKYKVGIDGESLTEL